MARRSSKMPWNAKPFFGGGRSPGWHAPVEQEEAVPAWGTGVHFDGATSLYRSSLAATDNADFSWVGWVKIAEAEGSNAIAFVSDDNGNYAPQLLFDVVVPDETFFASTFNGIFPTNPFDVNSTTTPSTFNAWNCIIFSCEADASAGNKRAKLYVDDVDATVIGADTGSAFTFALNGKSFSFGDDQQGDPFTGDVADFRFMPGVSLLDGGGDIPEATRRLFIDGDGKPVDPAVATASLGAPCILFSGDATSFGANQGTGGAFILAGAITNASSNPSD